MINHKSNILVSICCVTYNHALFIRKALDGFLMQEPPSCMPKDAKLSDWCEILIHDDCSTDGTTEIVREYAAKYPDVIFPLYEEVNQFSRGGAGKMDLYNYNRARGKYIAYCEGDDYWTDAHKLQKQVDFMESHPDYSICWHRCKQLVVENGEELEDNCWKILPKGVDGMDIDIDTYLSGWYTQPLTMLFRFSSYDFNWRKQYKYYRDMQELYYLLKAGKGYLFSFEGGVYSMHEGGISSLLARDKQYQLSYDLASEWYRVEKDKFIKRYYVNTLQWLISNHANIQGTNRVRMVLKLFLLTGNIKHLIKNIKSVICNDYESNI